MLQSRERLFFSGFIKNQPVFEIKNNDPRKVNFLSCVGLLKPAYR